MVCYVFGSLAGISWYVLNENCTNMFGNSSYVWAHNNSACALCGLQSVVWIWMKRKRNRKRNLYGTNQSRDQVFMQIISVVFHISWRIIRCYWPMIQTIPLCQVISDVIEILEHREGKDKKCENTVMELNVLVCSSQC